MKIKHKREPVTTYQSLKGGDVFRFQLGAADLCMYINLDKYVLLSDGSLVTGRGKGCCMVEKIEGEFVCK